MVMTGNNSKGLGGGRGLVNQGMLGINLCNTRGKVDTVTGVEENLKECAVCSIHTVNTSCSRFSW